jgi:DNA-binding transcriptional regulator LsrR (DeoR family)
MPGIPYSDDQLILAARLYFIDGLPQERIARLANVSQSKVSRMLALARERGIVRVTVPEYQPRAEAVEADLAQKLGVEAVVVRSVAGLRTPDLRQAVGYFAAAAASGWLDRAGSVGIAGGRTMQSLVENMRPAAAAHGPTVIQAMGNIDSSPGAYDALELGRLLAQRWRGTLLTLNTPALLPDAETCGRLLALDQIRKVMAQLAGAALVFVGIGTLANSVFLERKVLGPGEIETLRRAGAVGEILGRFFDARGSECETALAHRVVSLGLDELRRAPRRVAVLAGADRTAAVLAAIQGGLVNTLIIDEAGAAGLLEAAA